MTCATEVKEQGFGQRGRNVRLLGTKHMKELKGAKYEVNLQNTI